MRDGWLWFKILLPLVPLPLATTWLAEGPSHPGFWFGMSFSIVLLPLVALDQVRNARESDVRGYENAVADAADKLAAAVLPRERSQRHLLLGGDTTAAAVGFERENSPFRDAGGRPFGDVHTVRAYYQGLRPGRLVILGQAGAGKTVLAVELLIGLLEEREDTGRGPVPVRISLAGWDARPLEEWLTGHLTDVYRIPPRMAGDLVEQRHVLPILDGLDEMDGENESPARAEDALRALNEYLGTKTRAPVVLTCRERRYEALRQAGLSLLDATHVHVRPLDATQIVDYLLREFRSPEEEQAWGPVLDELARSPQDVLAGLLSSPWRLTLATTVYQGDGAPRELLSYTSADALDEHLLPRFVPATTRLYPRRPGDFYRPERVTAWLGQLAQHLDQRAGSGLSGTEFFLHQIWPAAGTIATRTMHCALLALGAAAFADFVVGLVESEVAAYAGVLLVVMLPFGITSSPTPKRMEFRQMLSRDSIRRLATGIFWGLGITLAVAISFSAAYGIATQGIGEHIVRLLPLGVSFGLLLGPVLGIFLGFNRGMAGSMSPTDPLRNDFRFGLTFAALFWSGFGLLIWPTYRLLHWLSMKFQIDAVNYFLQGASVDELYTEYGPLYGLSSGLLAEIMPEGSAYAALAGICGLLEVLIIGLVFGSTAWVRYAVAVTLLALRYGMPLRLGSFVEWAHGAGLLRASGTAYQFRHLELQRWALGTVSRQQ